MNWPDMLVSLSLRAILFAWRPGCCIGKRGLEFAGLWSDGQKLNRQSYSVGPAWPFTVNDTNRFNGLRLKAPGESLFLPQRLDRIHPRRF